MAQISIKSEVFLSLYAKLLPILEQLDKKRQGFGRPVTFRMEPFHSSQVLIVLEDLRKVAEQGIALAGVDASQVVLESNEIRMIEWSQSLAGQT